MDVQIVECSDTGNVLNLDRANNYLCRMSFFQQQNYSDPPSRRCTHLWSHFFGCLILGGWNFEDYVHYVHDLGNNVIKRDKHTILFTYFATSHDLLGYDGSFIPVSLSIPILIPILG